MLLGTFQRPEKKPPQYQKDWEINLAICTAMLVHSQRNDMPLHSSAHMPPNFIRA
jgi:hypothetical protein